MALPLLNFPEINARFQKNDTGILQIFDIVRKKFVVLSPEEWVRQHIIHYMVTFKEVPLSMISVEKQLLLNGTKRRTDIVIYHNNRKPVMIIECKAPEVVLDQSAINQSLRYNLTLNVPFVFISNGHKHVSLHISNQIPSVLKEFPTYVVMTSETLI